MDGYGISVGFDGRQLVVVPKNAVAEVALGGGRLEVSSSALLSVSMTKARLFRNGCLDLVVRDGRACRLHFTRGQQTDFEKLYHGLLSSRVEASSAVEVSRPQPEKSRPAPVAPSGTTLLLRGRGWFGQEVVGESHYFRALRALAGKASTGERETTARLRREPSNPHDRNAVQVLVEGQLVGYLPRESAVEYAASLQVLERSNRIAECRARLWWRRGPGDFIASVSLDLADPDVLFPINDVDDRSPHMTVPAGRSYQLTRESEHMDVLEPLLQRAHPQSKALVVASLRAVERTGPRSTSEVVVVFVDGQEIGELTKQTSAKLLTVVRPLQNAGITCYADVVLTGNALAVEAKLNISSPEDLPHDFVQRLKNTTRQA
ncbi:HIRAN domain-containing protein [Lentzea sp. NPDC059081]|uniref:HIRAN domain-containing protein n=1 Tax=Lentzea sp. NPDC059081 TaxID=3346719 RepID=UPI003693CDCF